MDINTPTIETKRLCLRKFTMDDARSFFDIMRDTEVNTFLPWFPLKTLAEAKRKLTDDYLKSYEKKNGFRYAICLKDENIPIGYVNVSMDDSHDFGYGLKKEYWRQGIVTEACMAVVELLQETGIPYITATHDIHNIRSGVVMKKIGMQYCYTYKEQWQPKNIPVYFRMYQLNFDEYKDRVYQKYWNIYSEHFIEESI